MNMPTPGSQQWLDLVVEDVVDPATGVVDPHHHLWPPEGGLPYGLDDLLTDLGDGHQVDATVFVECGAAYRRSDPDPMAPVGETRFVADAADQPGGEVIRGIVARANLRLDNLDEVLNAHDAAAGGRFRGIRHHLACADDPESYRIPGAAEPDLAADRSFRRGVRRLGERGLTYDAWLYHFQLDDLIDLVRACDGTTVILDHFGTPVGVGRWAGRRHEVWEGWRPRMAALAACENVVVKLGGLAMPDNGYGWDTAERPPSSDEMLAAQGDWYRATIDEFGPHRCMFESNFPVDRWSLSYRTVWNAFKKIAAEYSTSEAADLLGGTARRVYSI